MAFQTRNRPPPIRIRSFHEKGSPKTVNTGAVSCTMKEMVASSTSRMTRAAPMPIRRARARWFSGSLFDRIEMKMRLSIPSTTSSAIRVASATHAVGSLTQSKYPASHSCETVPCWPGGARGEAEQN